MWSILAHTVRAGGALFSRIGPYLLSAAAGALLLKGTPNSTEQRQTGDNGIQVHGQSITLNVTHGDTTKVNEPQKGADTVVQTSQPLPYKGIAWIGGITLVVIYMWYALRSGHKLMQTKSAWMYWQRKPENHEHDDHSLIYRIQSQYLDERNPSNAERPLVHFLKDIEHEQNTLKTYLSILAVIETLHLTPFINDSSWYRQRAHDGIGQLDELRAIGMHWLYRSGKQKRCHDENTC